MESIAEHFNRLLECSSMPKTRLDIEKVVRDFDRYSDDQIIADPPSARVLGISLSSLLRSNPIPQVKLSARRRGRRVGDLRALIRGGRAAAE
jgi:MoxR-like ATPase